MTRPSTPSTPSAHEPRPEPRPDGAPRSPSRRRFLGLAASGIAVGAAAATAGPGALDRLVRTWRGEDTAYDPPGADPGLVLVTVQLGGGLDFLDTVVPLDSRRYRTLRGRDAIAGDRTVPIDDDYGLFELPYVAERWHAGDVAIVHGVGCRESTLSHFVETAMWERGSHDPATSTGWLGRALDEFGGPDVDPLVAVGVGDLSPALRAPGWDPVAVPDDGRLPWTAAFVEDNPDLVRVYGQLLDATGGPTRRATPAGARQDLAEQVRASQSLVRTVGETIDGVIPLDRLAAADEAMENHEDDDEVPATGPGRVGHRLSVVADLITGGMPSRAYHVLHDGFDTHARQATDLPVLLGQLDRALRDFHTRLGPSAERVVIATWTEFGRRPELNGDGTDHGTAGTELVIGPAVRGGHHGEPVSLDRFDRDGNFLVTTDYRDYLGGLVQGTLGVDGSAVAPGGTGPLELLR
jgi:uncharacterized protein (DUF1501 family)